MAKPRKLTEAELAFIESTLDLKDNIEIQSTDENEITIIHKEEKRKKATKKTPPYKNPMHWVVGFIMAPVLFSGVFMFFLMRLEIIFGSGSLKWLSDSDDGTLVVKTADEMGMTWLPEVIQIYQQRWVIVGILFTTFFLLAIAVIIYDNIIQPRLKMKKAEKKSRENNPSTVENDTQEEATNNEQHE